MWLDNISNIPSLAIFDWSIFSMAIAALGSGLASYAGNRQERSYDDKYLQTRVEAFKKIRAQREALTSTLKMYLGPDFDVNTVSYGGDDFKDIVELRAFVAESKPAEVTPRGAKTQRGANPNVPGAYIERSGSAVGTSQVRREKKDTVVDSNFTADDKTTRRDDRDQAVKYRLASAPVDVAEEKAQQLEQVKAQGVPSVIPIGGLNNPFNEEDKDGIA